MLKKEQKTNIKVTANFSLSELEFYDKIPVELVENSKFLLEQLQIIRDHFGRPITIISGYRSPSRNAAVGGKSKSVHMTGGAADIKVSGLSASFVYAEIEKLIKSGKLYNGGLGVYPDFVHYDIRSEKLGYKPGARWQG